MREGNGLGEWSPSDRPRSPDAVRPLGIAVVVGLCAFIIGIGAARFVGSGSDLRSTVWTPTGDAGDAAVETGAATPDASVAGSAEVEEATVGGAVEARSDGSMQVAPTSSLVIVQVSVTTCGARSFGTGVLIDDDLIITAAHVIGDAALVRIDYGATVLTGEVLGVFADDRDLALIEVDASMALPLPGGIVPAAGGAITAAGHPEGGPRVAVVGPRIAVPPKAEAVVRGDLLAFDAPAQLGMSGGPVLDAAGDLIGILVAIETESGTAIAVTIDDPGSVAGAPLVDGECPTAA